MCEPTFGMMFDHYNNLSRFKKRRSNRKKPHISKPDPMLSFTKNHLSPKRRNTLIHVRHIFINDRTLELGA